MVTTNKNIDARIASMKRAGVKAGDIAKTLNSEGIKTARGNKWTKVNVAYRLHFKSGNRRTKSTSFNPTVTLSLTDIVGLRLNRKVKLALIQKMI